MPKCCAVSPTSWNTKRLCVCHTPSLSLLPPPKFPLLPANLKAKCCLCWTLGVGEKTPSEEGRRQTGDNVCRRALPLPDNFFLLKPDESFSLYCCYGSNHKLWPVLKEKTLSRADYADILITGIAALRLSLQPKLLLFVSLAQVLHPFVFSAHLHSSLTVYSFRTQCIRL